MVSIVVDQLNDNQESICKELKRGKIKTKIKKGSKSPVNEIFMAWKLHNCALNSHLTHSFPTNFLP